MVTQFLCFVKLLSRVLANLSLLPPPFLKLSDSNQGNMLQFSDLPYRKSHMQNVNTDDTPRAMEVLSSQNMAKSQQCPSQSKQISFLMTEEQASAEFHKSYPDSL